MTDPRADAARAQIAKDIAVKHRCTNCHGLHAPEAPCHAPQPAHPKAAEARALLASQRLSLCPCGVKPNDCADHRQTGNAA